MSVINSLPVDFAGHMLSLKDKHILIAGAETELGHELSLRLADLGATMILIGRKEKLIASLYDRIVDDNSPEPLLVAFDLAKAQDSDYAYFAENLAGVCSHLDGLIHLPTSTFPLTPVALSDPTTWRHAYQQHFLTPMLLTRALYPSFTNSCSVIFNTLPSGRCGKSYWGAISTMNAALENLSQTLADENDRVRFNTLDIGKVNSAVRHKYYPAEDKSKLRSCDDSLLLDFFIYLLSDMSATISGKMFTVPDLG